MAAGIARAFAARAGLEGEAADRLIMVVEEWVANVVEHGGPQGGARIVLRFAWQNGVVRLTFSDAGRPFDPRLAPIAAPNHQRGGGAGLALIDSLCRITTYTRRSGRNRVVLEMALE